MSCCCPLIIGDRIFIVTANGVDENHLNIPSPTAPSFICISKDKGPITSIHAIHIKETFFVGQNQ